MTIQTFSGGCSRMADQLVHQQENILMDLCRVTTIQLIIEPHRHFSNYLE